MSFSTNEPLLTKKLCPNLAMSAAPNTDRGGIYHGEAQAIWIRTGASLNTDQRNHLAELGIILDQSHTAYSQGASFVYTAELSPGANLKAFLALPTILEARGSTRLEPLEDTSPARSALEELKIPSGASFRVAENPATVSTEWRKMVISAHADRWVGFTFNPTPLDLVSNSHIRAVGRVVDDLYSSEFREMVSPLNRLYPVLSDVSSNIVAVLAQSIRDKTCLEANNTAAFIAALEGELEDSITAAPQLDHSRKKALCEVIESVMHDVKTFVRRSINEANACVAEERRVGISCLPGDPSVKDLHKLYYPRAKQAASPWQRLAGGAERRPIDSESADVVGAPREDVPLVEHVYAQDHSDVDIEWHSES